MLKQVLFYIAGWSSSSLRVSLARGRRCNSYPCNQKSIKEVVSKQRKFKNSKEFYNKFKEYVVYCKKEERLPNVAGFCVYCDINRDTFYAQEDLYSDTFKKINEILEDEALNNKFLNDARIIFYMKNKCGYKDKQEIDTTSSNKITIINDLPSDGNEDK